MNGKEKLLSLRGEIDKIDRELVGLFLKRMQICEEVAQAKADGNIALVDASREQQVIDAALSQAGEGNRTETASFIRTVIALAKIKQNKTMSMLRDVDFPPSVPLKKTGVTVGFQGVSGAWGEQGAEQLFPDSKLIQHEYFEDVFEAVKAGRVDYGVLPIENSQTGAIGEVYDLLRKHSCYIVGEVWITVAQCLLGINGASVSDIREVFSHPEGFKQSRRFLKDKSWDLTACRNTAYAAQKVADKNDVKYAAIGSRRAGKAYGLSVLSPDIMDDSGNRTRFIAIAAAPCYDESCGITSITFSTSHKSGALCAALESFTVAGVNLTRIESRPVSHDRYRFFADLQTNILSDVTLDALRQASAQCDYFEVLGCYSATQEKPPQ